jgi:predicted ArsR family transcriptional regulator
MTKTPSIKPKAVEANPPALSKNQTVIALLEREGGVTLEEIASTTNWQPHSVRSFLTGLKKKGQNIENNKVNGVRHYRILKQDIA